MIGDTCITSIAYRNSLRQDDNFAPDLLHTSMPQEQSAADLRQDEILLQTCRILVCHRTQSAADLRQDETIETNHLMHIHYYFTRVTEKYIYT